MIDYFKQDNKRIRNRNRFPLILSILLVIKTNDFFYDYYFSISYFYFVYDL